MRHGVASIAIWACLATGAAAQEPLLPLLPMPAEVTRGTGSFVVGAGAGVTTPPGDSDAAGAARLLIAHVASARGLRLTQGVGGGQAAIRFVRDAGLASSPEAYRLVVASDGVRIAAAGRAGFVNGAMTLAQLLSPDRVFGAPVTLPALDIRDAPRFAWRGFMVDTARHFQPLESLFLIVDQMAAVKLNTLHLHLTDDQGWRFEVKRYPRLTMVGGWRTPPSAGGPAPAERVGGFYTQAELKRLVAYAAERGVTIVPEIDLPGHAQALVAAYPEVGVMGDTPAVGHDWGVNPYLIDPGPKGVAFIEAVLDELLAVFPSAYIHLGGDEAIKDQWQRSPRIQAQIRALGLKDEDQLQSWFMNTLGRYLQTKGRRLIGWDEILEGGLPPSATVMSWRGEAGGVAASTQGHDVVLSPAPELYLNYTQSDAEDEPPAHVNLRPLASYYAYDPAPAGIAPDKMKHVIGVQANVWSEYMVTPWQIQHMAFPRLAAVAENGWAQRPRDFAGFVQRLEPQIDRWRRAGIEVADSAWAVRFKPQDTRAAALAAGRASLALSAEVPGGSIRYTLDGSTPTVRSAAYTSPIAVPLGKTVTAVRFDAAGAAVAAPRRFAVSRTALMRMAGGDLVPCPGRHFGVRMPLTQDATTNGPAYNIDLFDACSVFPAAPLATAKTITVETARIARAFGLAHDFDKVRQYYNATPYGELLVTARCATKDAPRPPLVARFTLPDPASAPQRQRFTAELPAGLAGSPDLCLVFTAPTSGPLYAVEAVQLSESK